MTDVKNDEPMDHQSYVSERLREIGDRKSKTVIAADAGFRSPGMLDMIASGEAKLPLDRVQDLAHGLECDPAALMRLALPQFMEDRTARLVLAAGATELQTRIDQLGTWLIALSTNMRIALEGMDRTAGAVQTLAESVGTDFERVDHLRIEIEKRGTALIGYPAGPGPDNATN